LEEDKIMEIYLYEHEMKAAIRQYVARQIGMSRSVHHKRIIIEFQQENENAKSTGYGKIKMDRVQINVYGEGDD
jgi:hypothetical protein